MMAFALMVFATASISFTIAIAGIFRSVRESLDRLHPKFGELFRCPWCLSHYVAAGILAVAGPDVWNGDVFGIHPAVGFLATLFAIVGASGLIHFVLLRAYEPVMEAEAERAIERMREREAEA